MPVNPSKARLVASLAVCVLLVVTCGGTGDSDGGSEKTELRVGVLPLTAVAPIYLGIEKGFFSDENLNVKPQLAQGGAAIVPAVVSGDYQFGYSNNVSLLLAAKKGLSLRIVAEGNQAATEPDEATDALVVGKDNDIKDVKELEGATLGVNTLQNIGEVAIKASLEKRGVDTSTIKFVETPFPEMVAAVQEDKVDAGWVVEPFLQQAKADNMRMLAHPFFETAERLSIGTYFSSARYAAENPDIVEGFTKAVNRSLEYAQQHPAEVRQITQEYTEIPRRTAEKMRLTHFTPELNAKSIELLAELMVKYGLADGEPNVDKLVAQ